jgi:hypothetical protein
MLAAMSDDTELRALATSESQDALLRTDSVQSFLQDVVDRAGEHVAPGVSATITVLLHGQLLTVTSSHAAAWQADQLQYDLDAGPCVEAVHRGTETVVRNLETDDRWPDWRQEALRLGFRSASATPVSTDDGAASLALNLYSREVDAFDGGLMKRAQILAGETTRGLRIALRIADQRAVNDQLQAALVSRSTIDQALGVIMGQNRCTREEAFAVLRKASQHRNVRLRDVAASVITNLTGHPPADPHSFEPRS